MKRLIFFTLFLSTVVFAQVVVSPNMNLPVPIPGETSGPDWADDINSSLNIIDIHNHASGQGVQINPDGININADFPMNNNNITTAKTVRFYSQALPIASTSPNVGAVYVSGNELYYNDYTGGHQVQITNGGSVNAGAGSITGLPSGTASVAYSGGTYVFQSATNTSANIDGGSYIYRNSTVNSKGLTLSPPNAMATDYGVTLPPVNTSGGTVFMTYDTSGNMGLGPLTSGGITGGNIATATITEDKLAARPSGTAAGNISTSSTINANFVITSTTQSSPVSITGASVTLTTTGRPVIISFMPLQQSTTLAGLVNSGITVSGDPSGGTGDGNFLFQLVRGSTGIAQVQNGQTVITSDVERLNPAKALYVLDNVAAGTYTWTVNAFSGSTNLKLSFTNVVLVAYEL